MKILKCYQEINKRDISHVKLTSRYFGKRRMMNDRCLPWYIWLQLLNSEVSREKTGAPAYDLSTRCGLGILYRCWSKLAIFLPSIRPFPTGIAVTESGTVSVSSSEEHSLFFSLKEGDPRQHASHLPEGLFVFHLAKFILFGENNQGWASEY